MSELPGMWDESDLRGGETDCAEDLLIVRKLKEENAVLKEENERLKARVAELAAPAVQGEPVAEVRIENNYWNRGHFYEGRRKELKVVSSIQDLPVGTKLYTAPQPAEQKPMADVTALVEALEDIGASWHGVQTELEKYMRNVARRALAAHRKHGGGA